ncbi:MAG: flagellar biosynthetic protein FliO [Treponema sp.]|nr:flagellar biosynthetic protein FliO [Treponema sp.]
MLLIQISSISAQEEPAAEDPHRLAEQAMVLGDIPDSPAAGSRAGSSIWAVVRMILVLALAAAAIYGIVFIFKKSVKRTAASDPFLKVIASAHVGLNRYVHIVSVGSRAWLLGAGDGGVNLISEIDDKEIIDSMMLEDSRKSAETPGKMQDFLSLIRRMGVPVKQNQSGTDEIRKRRERLKEM